MRNSACHVREILLYFVVTEVSLKTSLAAVSPDAVTSPMLVVRRGMRAMIRGPTPKPTLDHKESKRTPAISVLKPPGKIAFKQIAELLDFGLKFRL
jgi:hypothetical protein